MDAQRGSIFEVGVGIPLQSRDNQVQVRASTRCAIGMASLRAGGCASACMCIFQQGQQWWHLAQLLHDQAQHKCMQALVSMAICICALLQVVHVVKPLMCVLHVAHGLYVVHVSRCEVVGCLHRLHAHLDMSISTGRKQSAQTCINCCRSQSRHFCASPHTSTKTTLAMASGLLPPLGCDSTSEKPNNVQSLHHSKSRFSFGWLWGSSHMCGKRCSLGFALHSGGAPLASKPTRN